MTALEFPLKMFENEAKTPEYWSDYYGSLITKSDNSYGKYCWEYW
eukprot:CAMPEP_0114656834 /NCGR_PEP_ID=MMETSP0191-20121206/12960_1 /TAXON_ID=126664 /ORGANISM="Sorites sp." /LENGTH=44 /DNA_ID= /DNA_START= /DNA_END= /DNA_ORIENTATION=